MAEKDDRTGQSRREVWEEAGVEIEEPEVYAAGSHLLLAFWDLDGTRGSTGFGFLPVGAIGIEAWSRVTGSDVEPWEGRILLEMDRARLMGPKEAMRQDDLPAQGINVAMFDALFG